MENKNDGGKPPPERQGPRCERGPEVTCDIRTTADDTSAPGGAQRAAPRPAPKWMRTLRELLARSGSTDERTKGLRFQRQEIQVAGYAGEPARVMAYRVAPESIERARELLGMGGAT